MTPDPDDRLRELGLVLPAATAPLASYVPLVVTGNLAFVSGHGPLGPDRRPAFSGRIGRDLTDSDAADAARLTVLNILATLRNGLGTLNALTRIVDLRCFLVAEPSSGAHLAVPQAILRMLRDVFGPASTGGYTTIGISASVLDLPITVDLVALTNA
jgi:enamine deaminase RidA (YjgF/YER057c/UK114 family)